MKKTVYNQNKVCIGNGKKYLNVGGTEEFGKGKNISRTLALNLQKYNYFQILSKNVEAITFFFANIVKCLCSLTCMRWRRVSRSWHLVSTLL